MHERSAFLSKRRFVLIVAPSVYTDKRLSPLPGVLRDAGRLRSVFEGHADAVRLFWLTGSVSLDSIWNAISAIRSEARPDDQLLVYLGGHGWREFDASNGRWKYYFVPSDARIGSIAEDGIASDELGD